MSASPNWLTLPHCGYLRLVEPSPESIADSLLRQHDLEGLKRLERELAQREAPLAEQIAVKLAASKLYMGTRPGPLHLTFVFAMYKETRRILPPDVDPLGEDFVNAKAGQLRWLLDGDSNWDLLMVDDGCPDGSGAAAERTIAEAGLDQNARVLYLADAIDNGHPTTTDLDSTDDSRKGGSIHLGMYEAASRSRPGHIIGYTDADMSTNLAQAGLLVEALDSGSICGAGSRREPASVVVKGGARNDRGKLFIYIWKQMLPQLQDIVDSQCGFKGFNGEAVPSLVSSAIEQKFAFDIELLLRCTIESGLAVPRVPVAWIDSEAASTTTDLEPYLDMLQAIALMYRRYSPPDTRAESFVELMESMDRDGWNKLVGDIPAAISSREPMEFTSWAGIDAEHLRAVINS